MKNLFVLAILILASSCAPQYGPKRDKTLSDKETISFTPSTRKGFGKNTVIEVSNNGLLSSISESELGAALTSDDIYYLSLSTQNALEQTSVGTSSVWSNPSNRNSGSLTPTKNYQNASGQHCREFVQLVNIGVEKVNASGSACRQADGTWKINE